LEDEEGQPLEPIVTLIPTFNFIIPDKRFQYSRKKTKSTVVAQNIVITRPISTAKQFDLN
jgi:hypothetical protein